MVIRIENLLYTNMIEYPKDLYTKEVLCIPWACPVMLLKSWRKISPTFVLSKICYLVFVFVYFLSPFVYLLICFWSWCSSATAVSCSPHETSEENSSSSNVCRGKTTTNEVLLFLSLVFLLCFDLCFIQNNKCDEDIEMCGYKMWCVLTAARKWEKQKQTKKRTRKEKAN